MSENQETHPDCKECAVISCYGPRDPKKEKLSCKETFEEKYAGFKRRHNMRTTLCSTCRFGIVREWGDWNEVKEGEKEYNGIQAKCLLAGDFVEVVTSCNQYKKMNRKITHHDPDFDKYEAEVLSKPGAPDKVKLDFDES